MTEYVTQHDQINEELTLMIRQLQPGSEGLPVEVYCFSSNKEWVSYEMIQADIMEHFMGVAPYFGLQLYERAASSWAPKITLNNKENDAN